MRHTFRSELDPSLELATAMLGRLEARSAFFVGVARAEAGGVADGSPSSSENSRTYKQLKVSSRSGVNSVSQIE